MLEEDSYNDDVDVVTAVDLLQLLRLLLLVLLLLLLVVLLFQSLVEDLIASMFIRLTCCRRRRWPYPSLTKFSACWRMYSYYPYIFVSLLFEYRMESLSSLVFKSGDVCLTSLAILL